MIATQNVTHFFSVYFFFASYYTLNIRNTFSDRTHVNLVEVPDEYVVAMREGLKWKCRCVADLRYERGYTPALERKARPEGARPKIGLKV